VKPRPLLGPDGVAVTVTVTAACVAEHPGDLALASGDVVVVTDDSDESWWKGYKQGDASKAVGVFPHNHTVVNCAVGAVVVALQDYHGPEPGARAEGAFSRTDGRLLTDAF
jgi:hypothetical protein